MCSGGRAPKHINYVLERGAIPVDTRVLETLRKFDAQTLAVARLGKPAPDFRLTTVGGEDIQLSQFKGKQPVVVVFIYGDT